MNWEERLIELFDDPLLANVYPLPQQITSDDRLSESFLEIIEWVEKTGKEPLGNPDDFNERILYRRLKNIRNDDEKRIYLKPLDKYNLL